MNEAVFINKVVYNSLKRIVTIEHEVDAAYDTPNFNKVFNEHYDETNLLYKFIYMLEEVYNITILNGSVKWGCNNG